MLAYHDAMPNDATWQTRITLVLSGALRIWGVSGTVLPDPQDAAAFFVAPDTGPTVRVRHEAAAGWTVMLVDPVPERPAAIGRHAGLPGLLRQLREDLAPDAPAGRLVIGAQPLLERGPDGP